MKTAFGRSFYWLNATQFLGALNDNIYKLLSFFFVMHLLGKERASEWISLGGAIFVIPFLLFTPAAGALADRFSKRDITVFVKALEVLVMLCAVAVFSTTWAAGAYIVLFLMSAQSALFGPSKYGIIPELVRREQLSAANGAIVMFTYLAIILGSAVGPWLGDLFRGRYAGAGAVCAAIAAIGLLTSLGIEKTPRARPAARPSVFFVRDVWRTLGLIRHERALVVAVVASAYFSLIGSYMQLNLIPFGMSHLSLSETGAGYLFFFAAVGIGVGAWLAGRLSGLKVEFGIVPVGGLLLTVATMAIGSGELSLNAVRLFVWLAGVGAGLYLIPLEAYIQFKSPPAHMGSVIAASGFLSWTGVLIGSALVYVFNVAMGWPPARGFAAMGIVTMVLGLVSFGLLPDFVSRLLSLTLARIPLRIRPRGEENLPMDGPVVLIANRVSPLDPFCLLTAQPRRVVFLVPRLFYEQPFWRLLYACLPAYPVDGNGFSERTSRAVAVARSALARGEAVCLFADFALNDAHVDGCVDKGFRHVVRGLEVPLVPVYLGGLWGTRIYHGYSPNQIRWPTGGPRPQVGVIFGEPMPASAPAFQLRMRLMELAGEYFEMRKSRHRSLGELFIRMARRTWSKAALDDTSGRSVTWGQALIGAVALARVLKPLTAGQENVGVLLPPSVGGFLVNVAIALLRKTSVNLNFTASMEAFRAAIEQAELRTIVTARAFLERFPQFSALPGLVYAEDLRARIGPAAKLRALLAARLAPIAALTPLRRASPDDVATIIFSSGTTGAPKGVMLTHHNIASNIESFWLVLRPTKQDRLCASLPLFHSFGLTCGLWLPAVSGISASYHVSPLDAAKIAEVVRTRRCTALFATPTFLMSYMRKATREDFASLRIVVAGAEKLKKRQADAFQQHFGLMPVEGYGATELSPVAALSLPDVDVDSVYKAGTKEGSVGQPVPGVAARVVDPETGAPLPPGETGMLMMKGPNVMAGYLHRPDLTAEAVVDGWYRTGDMASLDEEGYVRITDRLARFSKIGGEMVPHLAIEEVYLRILESSEPLLAVTSVSCDRRGERLVVLYTEAAGDPAFLHRIMVESNLPNLWKPARDAYFLIDSLPMTGSGKLDVKELRRLAERLAGNG